MPRDCDSSTLSDALIASLRLALVPGVGPLMRRSLLEKFGTPQAVLAAAPADLRAVNRVGPKLCRAICSAQEQIDVDAEIEICRRGQVQIITELDDVYPRLLRDLPDPPGVLFVRGQLLPADALAIAIVGSRHATHYGITQTERLASGLARAGFTIVSGLARGIDAAAHRGALTAGGRTIAVLASGVLNVYPPENQQLAEEIAAHGAVLSESPPRFEPLRGMFPQRNRIISGLSLGVLVVEASLRSGALITARHAMEQGRDVFAVPGPITSRMSHGCHRLIRDGAKLVETVDDVLEELGPLVEAIPARSDGREIHHPAELALNDLERQVLAAVPEDSTTVDSVIAASGLAASQVLSTLSVLEMRRLVRRLSANSVLRL
ncbi:MAG TPA: DNA-processing protein DprA [Pirellulales bacterium]|nr:DNA-processing protein DprA [Pirellulales bacterium]